MGFNNPYIEKIIGAMVTPYESSWQLDYCNPTSYENSAISIVNNFFDTIEKTGIAI